MRFLLHSKSGMSYLNLEGEDFKYIIKVRRHQVGDQIALRSLDNLSIEHLYQIDSVAGRECSLKLLSSRENRVENLSKLHIGWCIVDPKTIEKALPYLTEMGVHSITFIRCDRSQNQFRLDFARFHRIVESSIMQSGRTTLIKFQESKSVKQFLEEYPESIIFDFGGKTISPGEQFKTILIGCEGGFSSSERALFPENKLRSLSVPMILRSETAAITAAAFCL